MNENISTELLNQVKKLVIATEKTARKDFYDQVLGGSNRDLLQANKSFSDDFEIKNDLGYPVHILGIQTKYADGLDNCNIRIKDNRKREILTGKISLSQIGNRTNSTIQRDELPVSIILQEGTSLVIQIETKTVAVQPEEINVTLFGRRINK